MNSEVGFSRVSKLFLGLLGQNGLSKAVIAGYAYILYRFRRFIEERQLVTEEGINRILIQDFLRSFGHGALSAAQSEEVASRLRRFFRFTVDNNYFENNPLWVTDNEDSYAVCRSFFTHRQVQSFFTVIDTKTATGFMERTLFELIYGAGLYAEEIVSIKIADIDFLIGNVAVACTNSNGSARRVVPVSEFTLRYLQLYLQKVRPIFATRSSSDDFFIGWQGQTLATQWIEERFSMYAELSGLDAAEGSRVLRQSYIVHLLEAGINIGTLALLIGRAVQGDTEDSFEHLRDELRQYHPHGIVEDERLSAIVFSSE